MIEAVVWSGRPSPLILVALHAAESAAVILRHEHEVSPVDLCGFDHGRENPRQKRARGGQQGASRGRPRGSGSLVDPDVRLWRTRAAVADDRAMPPRRARLAGGGMQPLQDPRKPAARRDPPAARHAAMEARGLAEVPVVPEGALCATGAHDQTDRDARDHALSMGASGRRAVSGLAGLILILCHAA
jgi:hypothetical protein